MISLVSMTVHNKIAIVCVPEKEQYQRLVAEAFGFSEFNIGSVWKDHGNYVVNHLEQSVE